MIAIELLYLHTRSLCPPAVSNVSGSTHIDLCEITGAVGGKGQPAHGYNTDLNDARETGTLDYVMTNTVQGTRAADNLLLDWADVSENGMGASGSELCEGTMRGVALKFLKTKNNPEQRDRPAKPLQCLSGCTLGGGSLQVGADGKLVGGGSLCPAHLKLWLKGLQARDVGVAVSELEGPVYGDYCKVERLPAGATLVKAESGSASEKAPQLVLVVSRDEEAAGLIKRIKELYS